MARFAIDAHALAQLGGGNRSYVLGLLEGLRSLAWDGEIVLYMAPAGPPGAGRDAEGGDRATPEARQDPAHELLDVAADRELRRFGAAGPEDGLPRLDLQVLRARGSIRRLALELPRRLARDRVDAALFQYIGPVRSPCPVVLAVHDPSFVVAPGWLGWRLSARLWLTTVPALRRAAAVLAPSEWTAGVLRRRFPKAAERVHVVPLAASSRFRPGPADDDDRLRDSLGLPDRYLLYVGRRARRKNVALLVEAYLDAAAAQPALPPLLLVGPGGEADAALRRKIVDAGLDGRIAFRDDVADEMLAAVYRGAELFCFPCRYEGFGLPVVEAMACGCPVVAAREGALPETVDDAGVLLPPDDRSAWAQAIITLCGAAEQRRRLRDRGLIRASAFTWRACAESTISILEGAVARTQP